MSTDEELGRPLAWALTIPSASLGKSITEHGLILGGCFAYTPEPTDLLCDPISVARSFDGIDLKTLMSSYCYPAQTGPPIGVPTNGLAGNPMSVLLRYVHQQLLNENDDKAKWALDLLSEMMVYGDWQNSFADKITKYRDILNSLAE